MPNLHKKILNCIYPLYTLISNHRRLVSLHYDLHFYLSLVSCFPNLHRIVSQHYSGFDLHFCLSLAFGAVVFVVVVKVIVNSNGQFLAEYQSKYGYGILIVADMLIKFSMIRDHLFKTSAIVHDPPPSPFYFYDYPLANLTFDPYPPKKC